MPMNLSTTVDIEKEWAIQYVRLTPHPEDLAHLAERVGAGESTVAPDYECKSQIVFLYSAPGESSGEFGASGPLVKNIVEMVGFHAECAQILQKLLGGATMTLEEAAALLGDVAEVRSKMAGSVANLGFGVEPFEVTEME